MSKSPSRDELEGACGEHETITQDLSVLASKGSLDAFSLPANVLCHFAFAAILLIPELLF